MATRSAFSLPSACSNRIAHLKSRTSLKPSLRGVELLEGRQLMATFTVTNLSASGAGSLRQAIIQSNATLGADTIDFGVTGTIRTGRSSLPAITDTVTIDGSSAPGFAAGPVVSVDFQGSKGLNFAAGSDRSVLQSLSLVNAGNSGVTLSASHITVEGNYIGLKTDGKSVAGNRGDGIRINASSHDNLIGNSNPVTSITYANADGVSIQPVSAWQGIRESSSMGHYLITGTSGNNGLLYDGPISGVGGASFLVNYPGATSTSVYGPDLLPDGGIRLVGSYKNGDGTVHGFLYEGTTAGLSGSAGYRTIDYPGAQYNYVHSTMGGLAVGNADGPEGNAPLGTGHAFLYDVAKSTLLPDIVYPGSTSTTAYGIWYNGGTSYTIVGGYSTLDGTGKSLSNGYMVDYDSASGAYQHWTSFSYPNGPIGQDFVTHFEGISSTESGVYTLSADSLQTGSANPAQGSWVSVRRNPDGSFGTGTWVDLNAPSTGSSISSSNSVIGNQVVGLVIGSSGTSPFQATINTGFQLSNVISGNAGNGIGIYGATDNQIAMNNIGTDATGTLKRGNARNGILVTDGAARNLIGGQATGGNDPTAGVFARPPQGNLISGNNGDGVLINKRSTLNLLSGNFIGTAASGNSVLGNRLDGVAIDGADGNQLIGCTLRQDPFVFYNVISGNGGNGLRINNANNTTVQANFMGVGANNATVVANGGDGLLISGRSTNTQVGGVIPLGNVISGNNRNGIEVKDKASGFTSFNTFAGLYAFGAAAPNRQDGILVTSTGGNNLIRTSIVSGNLGNGIELGGNATGVQVTDTAAGTNTKIETALPNGGSGILLSGNAHGNTIGGFQLSIEPQVTLSANNRYGIEFTGRARNNLVVNTFIGTNHNNTEALGNNLGGVYLGSCTSSNTIGGTSSADQNLILNNAGPGVTIQSSSNNLIIGDQIANNAGGGVVVNGGHNNQIGVPTAGNTIASNGNSGVSLNGNVTGTRVQSNDINTNATNGVTLTNARKVTIGGSIPGTGNRITANKAFGLYASGNCSGSVVQGIVIAANGVGNINVTNSTGIVVGS
jgi:hypothetical protein